MSFKYRVVFLKQPGCAACKAMYPIFLEAANELANEHGDLNIGFGEWDVTSDDWAFCDEINCDGTPNFAVFDSDTTLLGLNTEGILSKSSLKQFILQSIHAN